MKIEHEDKSAEHCADKAEHWLGKAVSLEADGRSEGMVSRALNVACQWEEFAYDGRT